MTDQELLEILHKNPQEGYKIIISKYTGLIYAVAHNKLSSVCTREDIEDCVSDIFALFYEERSAVNLSRGSIKAFLMILAKRVAIKRFNKTSTAKAKLTVMEDERFFHESLLAKEEAAAALIEKEERLLLIKAVKSLKEPDCTIILRKYYLGETAREIAKRVQLSQNAVEKRIARSLKKLKDILGGV